MTYANARRRAGGSLDHNRCINCWHLNLPEHAPFCSWYCGDTWARKVDRD